MDLSSTLPALAPLAEDQVRSLLIYYERQMPPNREGRPRRGTEDRLTRIDQRLNQSLHQLLADVIPVRERVFEQMDELVCSNRFMRRTLLDILYPEPLMPYPERLTDWARENLLWFDQKGNPAAQPTAALLVQRELDHRKRKLPPPRPKPRLFSCWRWDMLQQPPSSYELPLVLFDGDNFVLKPQPEPGPSPYVLVTPWKGVQWDDPAWQVYDDVAARWVGEPTDLQLEQWVTPEERGALPASALSSAMQALRLIIATRIPHQFPSS